MKKYIIALAAACLLATCASLPRGSYAYVDDGYSKDSGFYAKGGVHIPLDGGYKK